MSGLIGTDGKPLTSKKNLHDFIASGLSNGAASIDSPTMAGWNWWGGAADDDITAHLDVVRQRCRDLTLNAPVVAGMVNTLVTNIVGQGLNPEPTPDAKMLGMTDDEAQEWKKKVSRCLDVVLKSKDFDMRRRDNFHELTQLVVRSALESGDVFVAMPLVKRSGSLIDLRVQVIEADCIANPSGWSNPNDEETTGDVFGGVEVGNHDEVIAYHVATRHPLSKRTRFNIGPKEYIRRDYVRVPAFGAETGRRNMLHIMRSQRPGQRRGVPLLAPIVESMKIVDRYMKAELQAALIQALFTAYIQSERPEAALGQFIEGQNFPAESGMMSSQDFYEQNGMIQMGSGTIGFLAPGDSIVPISTTRPNSGFGPFVEAMLKMMGAAIGIPYELLILHFQSSFSASRAAMSVARAWFKVLMKWVVDDFCQPVIEEVMAMLVAGGHIDAPEFFTNPMKRKEYCSFKWSGPGAIIINPVAEVDAAIKRASVGFTTFQQETAEMNGGDWSVNAAERHQEQVVFENAPWNPTLTRVGTADLKVATGGGGDDTNPENGGG